jgi:hypothetical protein
VQRQRLRHGPAQRKRGRQGRERSLNRLAVWIEPDHRGRVANRDLCERAHHVVGLQAQRNARALAIGDDRPRVRVGRLEVLRHIDGEHAPLAAGQKMCRLTHVGTAGLDPIVRTDRDVECLLGVAVVVADEE